MLRKKYSHHRNSGMKLNGNKFRTAKKKEKSISSDKRINLQNSLLYYISDKLKETNSSKHILDYGS